MRPIFLAAIFLTLTSLAPVLINAQEAPIKEYFGLPSTLTFDSRNYQLSWSSHPSEQFYKQEYLVKGDNADRYQSMMLVDVLTGAVSARDIVAEKLSALKKQKAADPNVRYSSLPAAAGEYMIEFTLTAPGADAGTIDIIEHNVYRYKAFTGKSGQHGVLLIGFSARAYGPDVPAFSRALATKKTERAKKLKAFVLPPSSFL